MCENAPQAIYELEHMGLPFSRLDNGKIYQRAFGGATREYGREQAHRTCCAADRTGHAMLHTLYQKNLEQKVNFFNEWFAIDLVQTATGIAGVTAMCIETGELFSFMHARPFSQQAALAEFINRPPMLTLIRAMVLVWCCAQVCRCKIWSFGNSIQPESTVQVH